MARPNVRDQLLEAGQKTFHEKGFNGAGVQDITDAAGVPKGSFYNHFESKEALGAEIVQRYAANSPRRAILRDTSLPGLERLRRYFASIRTLFVDSKFERGCLLGNFGAELSSQSPMIRESLVAEFDTWTKQLAGAIADAQKDGSIGNKTKASELAAFILDAFEGAVLRARVEKSAAPLDRFRTMLFDQILEAQKER